MPGFGLFYRSHLLNFALVHFSAFTAEESASAFGPDSRTPEVKSFSKFDGQ